MGHPTGCSILPLNRPVSFGLGLLGKIGMKISIKATNFKLTDSIYTYIERKIGELEKFIKKVGEKDGSYKERPATEAWIEVGRTTRHHRKGNVFRAEAQIKLPGKYLRVESENLDLHLAIDEVKDELQRKLTKYKGKKDAEYKKGTRKAALLTEHKNLKI